MRDQHVDRILRDLVDGGAEADGDRGVEVRDLELDPDTGLIGFLAVLEAADVERQQPAAPAGARDEQSVANPPHDLSVVALDEVLGAAEAKQREWPRQ